MQRALSSEYQAHTYDGTTDSHIWNEIDYAIRTSKMFQLSARSLISVSITLRDVNEELHALAHKKIHEGICAAKYATTAAPSMLSPSMIR